MQLRVAILAIRLHKQDNKSALHKSRMATEAVNQPPQTGTDSNVANGTGMDALMEDAKKRGLQEEISRLTDNHLVYTDAAGGKLSYARKVREIFHPYRK